MFKKIKIFKNVSNFYKYERYILIFLVTKSLTEEEFNYLDDLTVCNNVYLFHFKNFKWIYLNNF
ncbi:hypothetical protein LCDVSa041L [Lymphocystis disease virus 3]|uniref:Uncharacterized protein n=1 Tax=Lymphocystis disease virus 3 TaxID=2560566 RepID=A0A1B2RVV6_9VIRU|nr:hypothetical protein BZK12_gp041 [Lymphocystis disease virus Sa]AOC55125.1 hypothetical protein LCDVSa041L [Lymphocystis disease virus 3]